MLKKNGLKNGKNKNCGKDNYTINKKKGWNNEKKLSINPIKNRK